MKFGFHILPCVLLLATFSMQAKGHGLGVDVRLRGDHVQLEAYYDDDSPVVDAKVIIKTRDRQKTLLEGKTDKNGKFDFNKPEIGKYIVEIHGEDGHFARSPFEVKGLEPTVNHKTEGILSEGLTRDQRTGPRKWLMALIGLAIIFTGAAFFRFVSSR